jgi:phage terminase large subunit
MTLAAALLAALVSAKQPGLPAEIRARKPTRASVSSGAPPSPEDIEKQIHARFQRWRADPVGFVEEELGGKPDEWQRDTLIAAATNPRIAMSACKGPGKTCVLAWIVWWFMALHPNAQVMAVSITKENLKDNLWKELATWQAKSALLQKAFDHGGDKIRHREHPKTWWVSARSFPKQADATQQANTLAGFHGKNIMVVLDEVSDYPMGVLSAAEAIFAVKGQRAKLVIAGNPTRNSGPLYTVVTSPKGWVIVRITGDPLDPKRSPRIDIDWAQGEIDKYGRDNAWVMCNILGLFPPSASDQLIAINLVLDAMRRDAPKLSYRADARVWGVDPARFGDDEAVLMRRQGVLMRKAIVWRNLDGVELAVRIAKEIHDAEKAGEPPDAIFIDVGGNGSSCFDHLVYLGFDELVHPVDFGSKADDSSRYANKRTEIWFALADWLKRKPAMLPHDMVLQAELPAPTFDFRVVNKRTVFILEKKEDMKARGVASPNRADGAALTFTDPVAAKSREARNKEAREEGRSNKAKVDYNPLEGF